MTASQTKSTGTKSQGSRVSATAVCVAGLVGGFLWWTWKSIRKDSSQQCTEKDDKEGKSSTPISLSPPKNRSRNRKKKRKAEREYENQRRAQKRDKQAKDSTPPPKKKQEEEEEDDGNNELYVSYSYYTGGRRDKANDPFGGNAILKK
mmetsp:Transcript_18275/g.43710  ORF Transcript_18275/g.43710 Transcript_18275/m.43710 type:complete len:148 (-) Transcript_18275:35-478(-)